MFEDLLVFLGVFGLLLLGHMAVRRSADAPEPDGLEPGETLLRSMAASAEIDGLTPDGNGYAYLTDRRVVWTPRMDSWHVENVRPGLPYTLPVVIDFADIRKASTPFYFGGSKLRIETRDVELTLRVEGRSFRAWLKHLLANARLLLPDDQPVQRARPSYSRTEFFAATRSYSVYLAFLLGIYGLYVLAKSLRSNLFGFSPEESIAVLAAGVCLSIAYAMWAGRTRT